MTRARGTGGVVLLGAMAVAAGTLSCERYEDNDLKLLTAYTAKKMCSCTFVIGQTEEFCREWSRVEPDVKTVKIDRRGQTVETQALGLWGARARFLGPKKGCVLE